MAGRTTTAAFLLPATTTVVVAFVFLVVLGLAAADPRPLNEAGGFGISPRRGLATSDGVCSDELSSCLADASCVTCLDEFNTHEPECLEEYASAAAGGLVPCDEGQEYVCCIVAEEDENCENDTTFSNYIECYFENTEDCPTLTVDLSDCNGASGLAFSWGALSVFRLTTVAGLFITTFGFVVW